MMNININILLLLLLLLLLVVVVVAPRISPASRPTRAGCSTRKSC